jgi:peptidyl-prolyl cis-trans isomerase C
MNPLKTTLALLLVSAAPLLAQDAASEAPASEAPPSGEAAAPAVDYDAGTVLATVNDVQITLGHVAQMVQRLPQQYQQLPDDVLFDGVLNQLVDQSLLAQAEQAKGPVPQAIQMAVDNELRAQLAARGLNALSGQPIPEADIAAAYETDFVNAPKVPEFSAAHILVATEDEAKAIVAELDGGADFAELARTRSMDTGSGANGGALGWFGQGMMVPEFEAAVLALEPGKLSAPVQSQFGWHVIRLDEKRDRPVPSLDEVRPAIEQDLQQKMVQKAIEDLRAAGKVELLETGVPPAAMRDTALFGE